MTTALQHHTIDAGHTAGFPTHTLASPRGARVTLVPSLAMLAWSFQVDGREFLGQPNTLAAFARDWATTGIPLLHPWANRLGGDRLQGTAHPTVTDSSLIPRDRRGLPIHGINLAGGGWRVIEAVADSRAARVAAAMDFSDPERLALFPFAHRVIVTATLADRMLTIETAVEATGDVAVPISFGWHPYFQVPDVPRSAWRVSLPQGRRESLDERMLPIGDSVPFGPIDGALGEATFDDLFSIPGGRPCFRVGGGGHRVEVTFGPEYEWAQVYAPADGALIAFEPMTAPGNAMITGRGLRWIVPGESFHAEYAVRIVSTSS